MQDGKLQTGVSALVYDLDGTLIDSAPGIEASLRVAFQAARRVLPSVDMRALIGPPITTIALNADPTLTPDELTVIEKVYRQDYDSSGWRSTVLFEEVEACLRLQHKSGIRLFVVTNKPSIPTANILGHLGLLPLFESVVSRNSRHPSYASKAEMLGDLVNTRSLDVSTSIMVGDTSEDQHAAQKNQLGFIHAAYGYGKAVDAALSFHRFAKLHELITLRKHHDQVQ